MYMMTIKNRRYEYVAVKALTEADYFKDGLIPLVEVVQEKVKYDNLVDSESGKYILENKPYKSGARKGQDHWCKAKDYSTEYDATLEDIEKRFKDTCVFVDYFRCDMRLYKDAKDRKCPLVIHLSNNLPAYLDKVKKVAIDTNMIPVITIKKGVGNLDSAGLIKFAQELKSLRQGRSIAIRIDDIDGYEHALTTALHLNDYLIYDINETPLDARLEEFDELNDLGIKATKILLCSPRKRDTGNGKYGEGHVINNSHITDYARYGFNGVGDYAGLRDNLPGDGGGKGRALALLYCGRSNEFCAYINDNVDLGSRGYRKVVSEILNDRAKLERVPGECMVLEALSKNAGTSSFGAFGTWISYTIERYVQQLYLTYGNYHF